MNVGRFNFSKCCTKTWNALPPFSLYANQNKLPPGNNWHEAYEVYSVVHSFNGGR